MGKYSPLDETLRLLKPSSFYVNDDMIALPPALSRSRSDRIPEIMGEIERLPAV